MKSVFITTVKIRLPQRRSQNNAKRACTEGNLNVLFKPILYATSKKGMQK